jgi:hypothetical protein
LGQMMRRWLKVSGGLAIVASAVFAFANWRSSPLHHRVCGPNSSANLRWMVYGRRANDDWPAKLCGCEIPADVAEAIRRGFDSNYGALLIEREVGREKLRQYVEKLGFGKNPK